MALIFLLWLEKGGRSAFKLMFYKQGHRYLILTFRLHLEILTKFSGL